MVSCCSSSSSFFLLLLLGLFVNLDDGRGTAPDPLVWCAGSLPKGPGLLMLFVTLPFCLVPLVFGMGIGFSFGVSSVTAEDVRVWPLFCVSSCQGVGLSGHFALAGWFC